MPAIKTANYIVSSPSRPSVNQTEIIGVNGVHKVFTVGAVVALTEDQVEALKLAGYEPVETDAEVPVEETTEATDAADDEKDSSPKKKRKGHR